MIVHNLHLNLVQKWKSARNVADGPPWCLQSSYTADISGSDCRVLILNKTFCCLILTTLGKLSLFKIYYGLIMHCERNEDAKNEVHHMRN